MDEVCKSRGHFRPVSCSDSNYHHFCQQEDSGFKAQTRELCAEQARDIYTLNAMHKIKQVCFLVRQKDCTER